MNFTFFYIGFEPDIVEKFKLVKVFGFNNIISSKIYLISDLKVMLDRDLADLFQVETKQLKRQVRRNIERFPEDFMFEPGNEEFDILRS